MPVVSLIRRGHVNVAYFMNRVNKVKLSGRQASGVSGRRRCIGPLVHWPTEPGLTALALLFNAQLAADDERDSNCHWTQSAVAAHEAQQSPALTTVKFLI